MAIALLQQLDSHLAARAVAAGGCCCALGLIFGERAIGWLRNRFREPIKSISPTVVRLHQHKASTPTMGGLFIVAALLFGVVAFGSLHDSQVLFAMLTALGFGAVGAVDDLVKLRTSRRGLSVRAKLIGQFGVALVVGVLTACQTDASIGKVGLNIVILVAAANAVNVTDGLDGLAGGCGFIASIAATVLLVSSGVAELSVVSAALAGALAAFLWFNRHPARVFMGDTGSQPLGALLGYFAVSTDSYWPLACVCGVFVVEATSVVMQLASYFFRGKRLFLCAPLHHHFQFAGWSELCIVRRFWLAAAGCAVAGLGLAQFNIDRTTVEKTAEIRGNLRVLPRVQRSKHNPRHFVTASDMTLVVQRESSFP